MRDRTIVTLVPRDTTTVRMLADGADADLAPVVPLRTYQMHGNRVIHPVDAAPGMALDPRVDRSRLGADREQEPGPLAKALMAVAGNPVR